MEGYGKAEKRNNSKEACAFTSYSRCYVWCHGAIIPIKETGAREI
jgi:hypothetical protein